MEYRIKEEKSYDAVSPGTIGVSVALAEREFTEDSGLVFLTKNNILSCSQNQD